MFMQQINSDWYSERIGGFYQFEIELLKITSKNRILIVAFPFIPNRKDFFSCTGIPTYSVSSHPIF
jgi:hypothetical protein